MEKWTVAAIVILAYSVVMIAIGLLAHRRTKNGNWKPPENTF
jgi:hypothetical protein